LEQLDSAFEQISTRMEGITISGRYGCSHLSSFRQHHSGLNTDQTCDCQPPISFDGGDLSRYSTSDSSGIQSDNKQQNQELILRVDCVSQDGLHRGVVFAEELSKRQWPLGWNIKVQHTALKKSNKGGIKLVNDKVQSL
jgi:hypothetical protein